MCHWTESGDSARLAGAEAACVRARLGCAINRNKKSLSWFTLAAISFPNGNDSATVFFHEGRQRQENKRSCFLTQQMTTQQCGHRAHFDVATKAASRRADCLILAHLD